MLVAVGVAIGWAFRPSSSGISGQLAFVRNGNAIYVVGADGTGLQKLRGSFGNPAYDPDWSPDGSRIVFVEDCGLHAMNVDGTGVKRLGARTPYCPKQPSWSPDGSQIAYSARSDSDSNAAVITVTGLSGAAPRFLTQEMESARFEDAYPDWSPDGKSIVFSRIAYGGSSPGAPDPALFVVNADGTGLRKVAPEPSAEKENMPAWSPDGSRLALGLVRGTFSGGGGHSYVYLTSPTGSGYENLTPPQPPVQPGGGDMGGMMEPGEWYPTWSPDGSRLAFALDHGIATMNTHGGGRGIVTSHPGDDRPHWRPGTTASTGGMGMNWWPWWITSLVGLLVVAAASVAVFVLERPRVRVVAAAAVVVAAGLAIAAPVVMTSSGAGSGGGPGMSPGMR